VIKVLAALAPVTGLVRVAGGLVKPPAAATPTGASYEDVQQRVLEAQAQRNEPSRAAARPRADRAQDHERLLRIQAETMIRRLDADGSGTLTASELGLMPAEFGRVDLNGDGIVDMGELMKGLQAGLVPHWKDH
jgi:hypothetical protein